MAETTMMMKISSMIRLCMIMMKTRMWNLNDSEWYYPLMYLKLIKLND